MDTMLIAVAKRGSKGVRGVRRRGTVELQDRNNHVLYLLFCGCTRADDSQLDLAWRVLEDLDIVAKRGTKCRRSCVTEFQCAARVLVHEYALNSDDVRTILLNQAANRLKNLAQAIGESALRAFDRAAGNVGWVIALKIENGKPGQA